MAQPTQILDGNSISFFNSLGDKTAEISVSSSGQFSFTPVSGSNQDVVLGNQSTTGDVEVGLPSQAVTLKLMGGGTISANGNSLTIGDQADGDSLVLNGNIPTVLKSQRPFVNVGTNPFTASAAFAGFFIRTGGNVTCSIFVTESVNLPTGSEFDFFQTSSAGNMLFETGSNGVTLNSKNGNLNLAGQFSSATLKFVGNNTFDLMGDLT